MLAELDDLEVKKIWDDSKIEKLTSKTIVDFEEFIKELNDIRQKGYALDNEENEIGVRCIAACIKNYKGKAENAFSISAPIIRMSDERVESLSADVLSLKEELSKAFGYKGN